MIYLTEELKNIKEDLTSNALELMGYSNKDDFNNMIYTASFEMSQSNTQQLMRWLNDEPNSFEYMEMVVTDIGIDNSDYSFYTHLENAYGLSIEEELFNQLYDIKMYMLYEMFMKEGFENIENRFYDNYIDIDCIDCVSGLEELVQGYKEYLEDI